MDDCPPWMAGFLPVRRYDGWCVSSDPQTEDRRISVIIRETEVRLSGQCLAGRRRLFQQYLAKNRSVTISLTVDHDSFPGKLAAIVPLGVRN
jgi:hypothetical protein